MNGVGGDWLEPRLLDGVSYALIANRYATLKELRDDYDISEAVQLYEVCMMNMANKRKAIEEGRK